MKKLGLALAALVALNVSAFAMKNQFNTDNLEIYAIESIKKDDPHEYDVIQRGTFKVMKQRIAKERLSIIIDS